MMWQQTAVNVISYLILKIITWTLSNHKQTNRPTNKQTDKSSELIIGEFGEFESVKM